LGDLKYIDLCALSRSVATPATAVVSRTSEAMKDAAVGAHTIRGTTRGILASVLKRGDLVFLYACRVFLPLEDLTGILVGFLQLCRSETPDFIFQPYLVAAATGFVQEILGRTDQCPLTDSSNLDRIFEAWVSLSGTHERLEKDNATQQKLVVCVERLLCHYFRGHSVASTQLYVFTLKHDPDNLVRRVLATREFHNSIGINACLVAQLLDSDPALFAPPFVKALSALESNENLKELWMAGMIDEAVQTVIAHMGGLPYLKDCAQALVESAIDRCQMFFSSLVSDQGFALNCSLACHVFPYPSVGLKELRDFMQQGRSLGNLGVRRLEKSREVRQDMCSSARSHKLF
jgi:hypothetical protein